MALPRNDKKPYQKDRLDLAIDRFARLEKPTRSDLNLVKVTAQVERGLDKYRAAAMNMSIEELEDEDHQSSLLAHFLTISGDPKRIQNVMPMRLCPEHTGMRLNCGRYWRGSSCG